MPGRVRKQKRAERITVRNLRECLSKRQLGKRGSIRHNAAEGEKAVTKIRKSLEKEKEKGGSNRDNKVCAFWKLRKRGGKQRKG